MQIQGLINDPELSHLPKLFVLDKIEEIEEKLDLDPSKLTQQDIALLDIIHQDGKYEELSEKYRNLKKTVKLPEPVEITKKSHSTGKASVTSDQSNVSIS